MRRLHRLLLIGMDTSYGRMTVKGIHNYCQLHGRWEYHVGDDAPNAFDRIKIVISEWKADGIIALVRSRECERIVKDSGLPAVNLSMRPQVGLPIVFVDNVAVGRTVARYLLNNGFRSFAFSSKTPELYATQRCEGFVAELAREGFDCDVFTDKFINANHEDWSINHQRMLPWLRSLKKPVGLFAIHDARGQNIAFVCDRLGLRVPDDVAIVSVGNGDFYCQMCNPPLSSVDINTQQIGFEAARLVHHLIRGGKAPAAPVLVPPRSVVVRQSSDTIALNDTDVVTALRYIRVHVDEHISVKDVLQNVPISRKTMERRFDTLVGRSPREEIIRIRVNRAKSLLEETELSIPAIAGKMGFPRRSIFSQFFHRETGMTPTAYRRKFHFAAMTG